MSDEEQGQGGLLAFCFCLLLIFLGLKWLVSSADNSK